MDSTVIIMLVIGALVAIAGFLLPEKRVVKADTRKEEEKIREYTKQQLKEAGSRIEDSAEEAIQNAVEKTERGLDRLTNEKMQAVNDYSDTVLKEINRNHEEVMFLYDMLNDKQVQIKNTAAEVAKTAKQAQEDAKDAELAAKQAAENAQNAEAAAKQAAENAQNAEAAAKQAAENAQNTEALTGQAAENVQNPGNAAFRTMEETQNVRQVLEQTVESTQRTEDEAKTEAEEKASGVVTGKAKAVRKKTSATEEINDPTVGAQPGTELKKKKVNKTVKAAETPKKQAAAGEAGPAKKKEEVSGSENPKDNIQIQFATGDGENQNNNIRILNLHKMGKSNMAIAKELGLGIGEVKLVIDLFEGM